MKTIDINCDMGESFGNFKVGNDLAVFPYVTSSNIACGFHGGDALTMEQTIKEAIEHQVQIGAHPGFPDLAGFGRRKMELPAEELKAVVKYQIAAIKGMAESLGTSVRYIKPHGALYNMAADDENVSKNLVSAVQEIDTDLIILGMADSIFQQVCQAAGCRFIAEAFADRVYEANGRLRSRSLPDSVITDPEQATRQILDIVLHKQVKAHDGSIVCLDAQSLCVHGDNPAALDILKAMDTAFEKQGITKKSFG